RRPAAPAGRRLPDQRLAERLPRQPGRDHLLGHERDPAQHHRRARAGPAQGAASGEHGVTLPDRPADPAPRPVTPKRLREFFAPRAIAMVGASDPSGWARFIVASSAAVGYAGPLITVHPGHAKAFGKPTVPSLRDLPEPVDLAFILAPVEAVENVLDDA